MKTGRRKRVTAKIRTGDDPILSKVCDEVMNGDDVSGVIRDMMFILTNSKTGVGLAAPQAGHAKRIAVIKESWPVYLVMINPEIVDHMSETLNAVEGCLSYPGQFKNLDRYSNILVRYSSEQGITIENRFTGFKARIIQHEIDHLNGKCKVSE